MSFDFFLPAFGNEFKRNQMARTIELTIRVAIRDAENPEILDLTRAICKLECQDMAMWIEDVPKING